jgi:hypothetical protein
MIKPYLFPDSVLSGNNYYYGQVVEWLGGGLQNLLQRFKSASDLNFTI